MKNSRSLGLSVSRSLLGILIALLFITGCVVEEDNKTTSATNIDHNSVCYDWAQHGSTNGVWVLDATDDKVCFEKTTGLMIFGNTKYTNVKAILTEGDTFGNFYIGNDYVGEIQAAFSTTGSLVAALANKNDIGPLYSNFTLMDIYGFESSLKIQISTKEYMYAPDFRNYANASIPDATTEAGTVNSSITVSGVGNIVDGTYVLVGVNIIHSYLDDLIVILTAPDTTEVVLSCRAGGSGDNYSNTLFIDAADTSITAGTPSFTGIYKSYRNSSATCNSGDISGSSTLSGLTGKSADGTWKLTVLDVAAGNSGKLVSWGIEFNQ